MTKISTNTFEYSEQEQTLATISRLEFPHYSQLDPSWGFEDGTERRMCGLTCTKAVIDHYSELTGVASLPMNEIVTIINDADDEKINGTSHAVEVEILKSQGLVSWRRNWDAPSTDIQWLIENERYSREQVDAISEQQLQELIFDSKHERELASISAALEEGTPVIASVAPGFGGNKADHQIVLLAREITPVGDSLIIMDPEKVPGSSLQVEPVERFLEYFNDRAIFTKL